METNKDNAKSPMPSTIQKIIEQYGSAVKGLKSTCGIVIGGISTHAAERIIDRNISLAALQDVILNAPISYPGNKPDTICQQKDNLRIVLSNNDGTIVSIIIRIH